ncbi:MAG: hypothetical protein QW046_04565 [Candidatus Micrarchaeaceae archaeon]
MVRRIGAIISDRTKKEFLREIMEETIADQARKAVREVYEKGLWYYCPVCMENGKKVLMEWKGNRESVRTYGGIDYMEAQCPVCHNDILARVRVSQSGDILTGFRYTPKIEYYKKEEIVKKKEE